MSRQQIDTAKQLLADEQGTVFKDWGGRLPIALIFPNTYPLGMSSLAVHTLYRLWNGRDDVVCERVFASPAYSRRAAPRPAMPLSIESGSPLDRFPVLAFTVSYELDYFQVVDLLRAANIPQRAAERDDLQPIIIAGGPAVSANPEPLAPLVDAVVIGEIEPIFDALTDALQLVPDRNQALAVLATLPGVYVPGLGSATAGVGPPDSRLHPQPVARQWLRNLDAFPTHSVILTPNTEFADTGLIEIARGCGRGCRFCLAGYAYRPPRQRSPEAIVAQARELLRFGDRLGLVSAAVSDYAQIDQLVQELRALGARLSVSSLRVDTLSEPLIRALAESGARTLTIAPEAGSERLRKVIHKTQTEGDVLRAVEMAGRYGLRQIKLYFMLGLPSEEEEDIRALVDLVLACNERFPHQITANITPFVPKAHTPFQRRAQYRAQANQRALGYVERELRRRGVEVRSESPAWAEVQGTLARGDRRLAEALLSANDVTPTSWRKALSALDISPEELLRERATDEPLPWDFVGDVQPSGPARERPLPVPPTL